MTLFLALFPLECQSILILLFPLKTVNDAILTTTHKLSTTIIALWNKSLKIKAPTCLRLPDLLVRIKQTEKTTHLFQHMLKDENRKVKFK